MPTVVQGFMARKAGIGMRFGTGTNEQYNEEDSETVDPFKGARTAKDLCESMRRL
jgi:hexokinase